MIDTICVGREVYYGVYTGVCVPPIMGRGSYHHLTVSSIYPIKEASINQ